MPDSRDNPGGPDVGAAELPSERGAALAEERASLLRVAALAAKGTSSADMIGAVAKEVAHVMHLPMVAVCRYDDDGASMTVVGAWGDRPHQFHAGSRWPLDGPSVSARVRETGRPARMEEYAGLPGAVADASPVSALQRVAGAPIIVDGHVWGMMATASPDRPLPDHVEDQLADFTAMVATAISNSQAREELHRLAEEQAALRRVATLVAEGAPPLELFAAVATEISKVLGLPQVGMLRYERDGTATVVGVTRAHHRFRPGSNWSLDGPSLTATVRATGRPARISSYAELPGAIAEAARMGGFLAGVGVPIVVDGELWGVVNASADRSLPLPRDAEHRLSQFTELVATALSNAAAHDELVASRVRIVEAADQQRRRVVRDLHDGAQQRLVHTVLTLGLARDMLDRESSPALELVEEALRQARQATTELRELAHGILPAALTRGGLRAGVDALASRSSVPVKLDVTESRFAASVEATAYFVVAEALTNVSKHAHAHEAWVRVKVDDGSLNVQVHDDGVGGAQTAGPGLIGMRDRLAALEGRLHVESPRGGGTTVVAAIPIAA